MTAVLCLFLFVVVNIDFVAAFFGWWWWWWCGGGGGGGGSVCFDLL